MTGKNSWLSQGIRPGLGYTALQLSKKNKSAKIAHPWKKNQVLWKVKSKINRVRYSKIKNKEDLLCR